MSSDERDKTRRTQKDDTSSTKGNGGIGGGNGDGGDKGEKRKSERSEQSAIPRETGLGGDKKSVADMSESDIRDLSEKQVKALDINAMAKACDKDEKTREKFKTFLENHGNKLSDSQIAHLDNKTLTKVIEHYPPSNWNDNQVKGLRAEQFEILAKSADKFQAFVEQHGDKLSNRQIYELDKETLAKVVDHYPFSKWSDDQVTSLRTEQLKSLAESGKLSEMTPEQLRGALDSTREEHFQPGHDDGTRVARSDKGKRQIIRSMEQVEKLSDGHLAQLGNDVKYFGQTQVDILAASDKFKEMTPGQIDLVLHNTDNKRQINQAEVIEKLGGEVEKLSPERLQALEESIQHVNEKHLKNLDMDRLSGKQIETLASKGRFSDLTDEQVKKSFGNPDPTFDASQVITALDKNVAELSEKNLQALGDNVRFLKQDQVVALAEKDGFAKMAAGQIDQALHNSDDGRKIGKIDQAKVIEKLGERVTSLDQRQLQELGTSVEHLSKEQLEQLATKGLPGEPSKLEGLGASVQYLSVTQLEGLAQSGPDGKLKDLGTEAAGYLTQTQLDYLASKGYFEQLDPDQIKKALSDRGSDPNSINHKQVIEKLGDKVESLSDKRLQALGDNIQYVKKEHLQKLEMSKLDVPQIQTLAREERFKDLTDQQVKDSLARTPDAVIDALGDKIDRLSDVQLQALGTNVEHLSKDQLQTLDTNVKYLSKDQLQTLDTRITDLTPEQVKNLASNDRFADMTATQIKQILARTDIKQSEVIAQIKDITQLDQKRLQALGTNVEYLSETQIQKLATRINELKKSQLQALDTNVKHLSETQIQALDNKITSLTENQIKALDDKVKYLSPTQLQVLDSRINELKDTQLQALDTKIQDLTPAQIKTLAQAKRLHELTSPQIRSTFGRSDIKQRDIVIRAGDDIYSFNRDQLQAMGTGVEHLSVPRLNRLADMGKLEGLGSSAQYLSVPQLEGLAQSGPDGKLKDLGTEAAGYLKQGQLDYLAANGHFEKLDPAQIKKALNGRDRSADPINQKQIIDALGDKVVDLSPENLRALGDSVQFLEQPRVDALIQKGNFAALTGDQIHNALHSGSIEQDKVIKMLGDNVVSLSPEQLKALGTGVVHLSPEQLDKLATTRLPGGGSKLEGLGSSAQYLKTEQLGWLAQKGQHVAIGEKYQGNDTQVYI